MLSDDDGERTLSEFREPRELNVVVAESTVRRRTAIPKTVSFERAALQLKAIRLLRDEESEQARGASHHQRPEEPYRVEP